MAFVTISREFGSFGTTISRHTAQSLGYDYIDKDIMEKVLGQYGLVAFPKFYESTHVFWERLQDENDNIIKVFGDTVREFARHNAVFVGRAGFAIVRGYENVLHVLIRAPFETRVQNTMKTLQMKDRGTAEAMVRQHDRARESYLKIFYKASAADAANFNLVIDTGRIPAKTAEQWIVEAARLLDKRKIDPAKSTLSIPSDSVLQSTVAGVLKAL